MIILILKLPHQPVPLWGPPRLGRLSQRCVRAAEYSMQPCEDPPVLCPPPSCVPLSPVTEWLHSEYASSSHWGLKCCIITLVSLFQWEKSLKQSWPPAFWKKIQNTQEIKRTRFNWMKQDSMCNFFFFFKSSFSSYKQTNKKHTEKTNNEFSLSRVSWMLQAGGRSLTQGKLNSLFFTVLLLLCFCSSSSFVSTMFVLIPICVLIQNEKVYKTTHVCFSQSSCSLKAWKAG